jgi:hypothetical protein
MRQLAGLVLAVVLSVGTIIYAELRFPPRSQAPSGQPRLAGSPAYIESIGDLSNPGLVGSALAVQFGPATETRGRAKIADEAREGRFLRYPLIANRNPQIDGTTLTYTVFVAEGTPTATSSNLDWFVLGCASQAEFERAFGALTLMPPNEGRWGTVLVKVPSASNGVRIELDIQGRCLGRIHLSQESPSQ